jgi:hypothetical protein
MPSPDPYGQGIQIAQLTDAPDAQSLAQALAGIGSLVPHTVLVYASAAARSAALTGTTAPTAGMTTWLVDVKRLECYDGAAWVPMNPATLVSSTGASATTGWSLISFAGRQRGGIITVNFMFTSSGATITPDSAGNLTDVVIGSIPTTPVNYAPQQDFATSIGDGVGHGEALIGADGTITLRSWVPGGNIVAGSGRNLSVSATYVNQ